MHANRGIYAALPLSLVPFGWVLFPLAGCSLTNPTVTAYVCLAGICGSGGLLKMACFCAAGQTHEIVETCPP